MKPDQLLHQFLQQLNAVISPGADVLGKEAQQKIKAAAQATFDKLDAEDLAWALMRHHGDS